MILNKLVYKQYRFIVQKVGILISQGQILVRQSRKDMFSSHLMIKKNYYTHGKTVVSPTKDQNSVDKKPDRIDLMEK